MGPGRRLRARSPWLPLRVSVALTAPRPALATLPWLSPLTLWQSQARSRALGRQVSHYSNRATSLF